MLKPKLGRLPYIALCMLVCTAPVAFVFVAVGLGGPTSVSTTNDMMLAALGSFAVCVFTYPAGVIGTVASYVAVYFGWVTPTEAVLVTAPLYIGAGYLQWYVLIPGYFKASPNPARNADAPPAGGTPVS